MLCFVGEGEVLLERACQSRHLVIEHIEPRRRMSDARTNAGKHLSKAPPTLFVVGGEEARDLPTQPSA